MRQYAPTITQYAPICPFEYYLKKKMVTIQLHLYFQNLQVNEQSK